MDRIALATTGDVVALDTAETGPFFSGFVLHPEVVAAALLVVARVARTRFYLPPAAVAVLTRDPVVTSTPEGLRFESFSGCCGVYARLDVLADALDTENARNGVTNVDVTADLQHALSAVLSGETLHLSIGSDAMTVTTLDASVVEQRVPLPTRWVKGLAESQVASSRMEPAYSLHATAAVRFLAALPSSSPTNATMWAVPALSSLRLASRPQAGAVCVSGPERLGVLGPLLRFATGLSAYGPRASADSSPLASAWQLDLPGARLTLTLSPEKSRGFSGEGGLLGALASPTAADDADLLRAVLAFEPRIEVESLARSAGLTPERTRSALAVLASSGQVGYDLAEGGYFHRPLPFDSSALLALNPRLADARTLVAAGLVRAAGGEWLVGIAGEEHVVRLVPKPGSCSCAWFGKHRGTRGPCKHVLAAGIVAEELE